MHLKLGYDIHFISHINIFLGCDTDRREKIIDDLNSQYARILQEKRSIFKSYSEMVEGNPYRVLASYSYDCKETPLRSQRVAMVPPVTDTGSDSSMDPDSRTDFLPSPFKNISKIKGHDEYIQIILNARTMAQVTNEPCPIMWRGFSSTITKNFELSFDSLKKELINALQSMLTITKEEKEVDIGLTLFKTMVFFF